VSRVLEARLATGPPLLDEDFTGATAHSGFTGYGSACLTGAPVAPAPGSGEHALTGCTELVPATVPLYPPIAFPVSPPLGAAPHGFLRLTDALPDQAGAVLFHEPIRATDGVEITFEQWQYGGSSTIPAFPGEVADGISFFLVDATATLDAPGAFGGSLGYAQKLPDNVGSIPGGIVPGVAGGYLGFGFDVLGNFYGDWEQRGRGCPLEGRSPAGDGLLVPAPGQNMVTVRGPVGADRTLGYCFLTATATGPHASTLPGTLHGTTAGPVSSDPSTAVGELEASRRTVTMVLEPEPVHTVTVYIDFHGGGGSQQVLSMQAPEPVPAAVKFGFAASTGAFTDVHLIRTLRVQALDPPPALALVKTGTPVVAGDLGAGDRIRYTFTVSNPGGGPVEGIQVTDPLVPDISCPATSLEAGASMVCEGFYTLTDADAARGSVSNVAIATGDGRDGPVESPPANFELSLLAIAASGTDAASLAGLLATSALLVALGGIALRRTSHRAR
jgi:uncharacterized repeat protein (TIGR01451 family)